MPRPGPRPYECVRRAWHSDRHQPSRGSLIQEIFRVVNEVHSPATKRNKEWQEKLPIVVLRAEEIMYSKANSEAEYMDLKTLWSRITDAINTIIRRDEILETGDLLQPCIEAALNLGCTPRRASRSHRCGTPCFYLSPVSEEHNRFSPGLAQNTIQTNLATNSQCMPIYSKFIKSSLMCPSHSGPEVQDPLRQSGNVSSCKFLLATDNAPPSKTNQWPAVENNQITSFCSVYPLHYGSGLETHPGLLPNPVSSSKEPVKVVMTESPAKISGTKLADGPWNPKQNGCDLSLRLGLSSSLPTVEKTNPQDVESTRYDCLQHGIKLNNQMPETGNVDVDVTLKKRKRYSDRPTEDEYFGWQTKLPCAD